MHYGYYIRKLYLLFKYFCEKHYDYDTATIKTRSFPNSK